MLSSIQQEISCSTLFSRGKKLKLLVHFSILVFTNTMKFVLSQVEQSFITSGPGYLLVISAPLMCTFEKCQGRSSL